MKKYILLKDLPDAKAGDVYIQRSIRPNEYENSMRVGNCISANWIIGNPKWFEEVKEKPFEQEFIEAAADFFLKYGAVQFTHEDLKQAFEAGRMRSGSFWIEENLVSFNRNFYAFETFEEYLGSKSHNKQ